MTDHHDLGKRLYPDIMAADGVTVLATGYGPDQREATAGAWVQARARGITPPADWTDPTDRPDLHRDPSWTREAP